MPKKWQRRKQDQVEENNSNPLKPSLGSLSGDFFVMRKYISPDFKCASWDEAAGYFDELLQRELTTKEEFVQWLKDKSELEAVLEENAAWRYINMTIDTTNAEFAESYRFFTQEIQPNLAPKDDALNRKMMEQPWVSELENSDDAYRIYFRGARTALELFNEANIPLEVEMSDLTQQYSGIIGAQTIQYNGEELTMPRAANFLKNPDRSVREEVYRLIVERRNQDTDQLNEIFNQLVKLRHQVALNSGCSDFRAYKFKSLGRFDYSIQDCLNFHDSIAESVVPMVKELYKAQAEKLGLEQLKPWDTEVDPNGSAPLHPFENGKELLAKSIATFKHLDVYFSDCLQTMDEKGYLDLDSKNGKAPGGYNYPLYESGIPFIFMNAAGAQRDVVTMVHEGGHAVHSFLSRDLELTGFKSLPSEVAELASMSMELMTMDHWTEFYDNESELKRAKLEQLHSILKVLPWIATIDAFQHWIYTHPEHTTEERTQEWLSISKKFGTGMVDFSGFEHAQAAAWHKQLHLFEVPFYYIEYGIAQLGAIGVWKNYKSNPSQAIADYKAALALGYTKSIPEIYATANLKFDFSSQTVSELMAFVKEESVAYQ